MLLPLLLSVFVANGVTAGHCAGIKHTSHAGAVHDYLDRLAPASKNAILHELMGPTVGSDVSSNHLADDPHVFDTDEFEFFLLSPSRGSWFPSFLIQNTPSILHIGSGMAVASIIRGLMSLLFPDRMTTPSFFEL